jgi:hypothetical protein
LRRQTHHHVIVETTITNKAIYTKDPTIFKGLIDAPMTSIKAVIYTKDLAIFKRLVDAPMTSIKVVIYTKF